MNPKLLNKEIQDFIILNIEASAPDLLLKHSYFKEVKLIEIVEQLESKQRSRKKLPTWFHGTDIYYPNKLNIEQTSSEITAAYKSNLISGNTLLDLTGGFGVDAYYYSKKIQQVIYCEINKELSDISRHNFTVLNVHNVTFLNEDGLKFLRSSNQSYDWIYLDPSRRHDHKGKVFLFSDCTPNVAENLDFLFDHTHNILVKASPMLDIKQGLSELKNVKEVHIIAVKNEVKELLFIIKKGYNDEAEVKTINLEHTSDQIYSFYRSHEEKADSNLGEIKGYLYEPNAALMKSGAFKLISTDFKVAKLHQHSHLYTSNKLIDFPGRKFKVLKVLPFNKKVLKKEIYGMKCNSSTRNFPVAVTILKKRFRLTDGGAHYLFFTTNIHNEKVVIVNQKA